MMSKDEELSPFDQLEQDAAEQEKSKEQVEPQVDKSVEADKTNLQDIVEKNPQAGQILVDHKAEWSEPTADEDIGSLKAPDPIADEAFKKYDDMSLEEAAQSIGQDMKANDVEISPFDRWEENAAKEPKEPEPEQDREQEQ